MAEKEKVPERDKTLINILERIGGELQRQGALLDEITARQNEVSQSMRSTGYQLSAQYGESEKTTDKIQDSLSRYRSDMLSIVNEQDHINEGVKELRKEVGKAIFSLETNNKRLENLEARLNASEKALKDHYEASQKHSDSIPKEFANVKQNESRLHADTEKRLGELHRETQRLLEKMNKETTRRLNVLDGIESSVGTLLIRTEPPEKKRPWIVRAFTLAGVFFKIRLPALIKRLFSRNS